AMSPHPSWRSGAVPRVLAVISSRLLLAFSKAEPCRGLLGGTFELSQACQAGGPLSEGSRLVQLVALAGIPGLRPQVVQVIAGHKHKYRPWAPGHRPVVSRSVSAFGACSEIPSARSISVQAHRPAPRWDHCCSS